jgi:hypothetical protein
MSVLSVSNDQTLCLEYVWRWPSEGDDSLRFIVRAESQKMEILLQRTANPDLFDFIVANSPPINEHTAPLYVERPTETGD